MKTVVIINRPLSEALKTEKKALENGFYPVLNPLQTISFLPLEVNEIQNYTTLLATSPQGIRSLSRYPSLFRKKLYVVGEGSKKLAKSLGFKNITAGHHNAKSLCEKIYQESKNQVPSVFYARGESVRFDAHKFLEKKGLLVKSINTYTSQPATSFSPSTFKFLTSNRSVFFLFYSVSSVNIFKKILPPNTSEFLKQHIACSLSVDITKTLQSLPFRYILTTPQIKESCFWDLINHKINDKIL